MFIKIFPLFTAMRITSSLHSVGVSMGRNDKESTVLALEHIEIDRLKVLSKGAEYAEYLTFR
jgi:hypothetical protein